MSDISPKRARGRLIRAGIAVGCALMLCGCVVYPAGYYHPRPVYYYGYGPGYYR